MDQPIRAELDTFWESHGDAEAWNFITTSNHNGDLYQLLTLLKSFRIFRAQGRRIRILAVNRPHYDLATLFTHVVDDVIHTPDARFSGRQINAWREEHGKAALQPGTLINTYVIDHFPLTMRPGAFWVPFLDEQWAWTLMWAYLLEIPMFMGRDVPTITAEMRRSADERFQSFGLPRGKTVVLFPYARTVQFQQDPAGIMKHFITLVRHLRQAGFEVCTSVAGNELPIEGTLGTFIPFSELIPFCEAAGHAVTVRSGISDILSSATCRKIHIYSNPQQAKYVAPIAYGLGGVEENLSFNFKLEDDPLRFSELVLERLAAPRGSKAASFVPQQVLDLLALPTGPSPPTGQVRTADFVIRVDGYRLCASGVLAEGWSGLEDWGIWSTGSRSVFYARPATSFLPAEEIKSGGDVVLRLELCFAIAPDTNPVLNYAISINEQPAIPFEARWPDGKTSHWPQGRWRTLKFPISSVALGQPAKITFIVDRPVSTRELSGGKVDDDRLIGIGLLKATYDVAPTSDA